MLWDGADSQWGWRCISILMNGINYSPLHNRKLKISAQLPDIVQYFCIQLCAHLLLEMKVLHNVQTLTKLPSRLNNRNFK